MFPTGELRYQEFLPKTIPGPQMRARLQWSLRGGPSVLGELPEGRGREGPRVRGFFPGSPGAQAFHLGDSLARVRLG